MARVAVLLMVLVAVGPAAATDYTVGGSQGWASGVDYSTWAAGKTFNVGDTLLFQYSFVHDVAEVSKSDYDGCSASNSLQSYSDQNTKIALSKPGSRYFICGTPGHCSAGMKLAVTVANSASPSTTPSTTPDGGSTPSSDAPTTPTTTTSPSSTATPASAKPPSTSKSTTNTSGAAARGGGSGMIYGALVLVLGFLVGNIAAAMG